jgi:hypothetical protein
VGFGVQEERMALTQELEPCVGDASGEDVPVEQVDLVEAHGFPFSGG